SRMNASVFVYSDKCSQVIHAREVKPCPNLLAYSISRRSAIRFPNRTRNKWCFGFNPLIEIEVTKRRLIGWNIDCVLNQIFHVLQRAEYTKCGIRRLPCLSVIKRAIAWSFVDMANGTRIRTISVSIDHARK